MFRLMTFGRLRLIDADGRHIAFPEKGLLILCHAQASRWQQKSRAEIARLFWGEVDQTQAYANLRKTISRIASRQDELGVSFLDFTSDTIAMTEAPLAFDRDTLMPPADAPPLEAFLQLADNIQNEFLADVRVQSLALHTWIEQERDRYMLSLRQALLDAIKLAAPIHRATFKSVALRLLDQNPDDEAVRAALTLFYDYPDQGRGSQAVIRPPAQPIDRTNAAEIDPAQTVAGAMRRRPPRMVLLPPTLTKVHVDGYAAALIEDVTIGLCALRSVSVLAPYTASQIVQRADKSELYERHAISYVLDTRITDEGSGHTLFAQLIFFGSDEVVWAERFDITPSRLAYSRRKLAERIASAIAYQVERSELQRVFFEENGAAYKNFLLGQQSLNRLDLSQVRRARKHFKGALREQANFAPALSGLARSFFFEWLLTARGDAELLSLAERHARDAIAANASLAAGYRELGVVKLYQRRYDESIHFLQRAEVLSPNYANVIASHADTLVQASRPAEGLDKIRHALDLNPLAPDEYFWTAAGASYSLGEYEQALGFIARMKDQMPADRLAAASWGMLGNARKARQLVQRTYEVHPNFDLEKWMAIVPFGEEWQKKHYIEGLRKAGFK